jgi:hypothetical protein
MPYQLDVDFTDQASATAQAPLNYVNPTAFKLVIDSQKYKNAQFIAPAKITSGKAIVCAIN